MHELGIAQSIVELSEQAALDAGATSVARVDLRVGALSGVLPEALEVCFDLAAEGTLVADAELRIERVPLRTRCPACEREKEPATVILACAECGRRLEIVSGRELEVASIDARLPDEETECTT